MKQEIHRLVSRFGRVALPFLTVLIASSGCASEKGLWRTTQTSDTTTAYEAFLTKYPNGVFRGQALQRLGSLRFSEAKTAKINCDPASDEYRPIAEEMISQKWHLVQDNPDVIVRVNLLPGRAEVEVVDRQPTRARQYWLLSVITSIAGRYRLESSGDADLNIPMTRKLTDEQFREAFSGAYRQAIASFTRKHE
jgi:hypothetical protein